MTFDFQSGLPAARLSLGRKYIPNGYIDLYSIRLIVGYMLCQIESRTCCHERTVHIVIVGSFFFLLLSKAFYCEKSIFCVVEAVETLRPTYVHYSCGKY